MADLDDELQARQEEEQRRKEALEVQRQQQRLATQQEEEKRQDSLKDQATQIVKQKIKQKVKQELVKKGAMRLIISTSPYWGTALLCILGFILILFIVIAVPVVACNSSVIDGVGIAVLKLAVAAIPGDVCAMLALNQGGAPSQTIIVPPDQPRPPGGGLTDAEARRILADTNICNYPLSHGRVDCVNAAEPQTSLQGIQQATISEVVGFKVACEVWAKNQNPPLGPCVVVVSGGTETTGGHAGGPCSHLSGNKIDIRRTDVVNLYIQSTFTSAGNRSGDPQYVNAAGISYVNEGDHWDIGGVGC